MNPLIVTATLALLFSTSAQAQEQLPPQPISPKPVCETMKGFSDFDFWLGDWNVYSNDEKRTLQGSNSITKHHKNCLLMENWTNTQGDTGSSMNYYDAVDDQWRQLWVAGGYSIDYTGGLNESGSMLLSGKINYYTSGKSKDFRGTWSPLTDGSVRQFFEQFDPKTQEWKVWFDGLYIRR